MIPLLGATIAAALWAAVSQQRIPALVAALFAITAVVVHVWARVRSGSDLVAQSDDPPGDVPDEQEDTEDLVSFVEPEVIPEEVDAAKDLLNEYRALSPKVAALSRFVMRRSEEAATQSTESAFSIAEDARKASSRVASLLNSVNFGDDSLESRVALLQEELSSFNDLVVELNQVNQTYGRDLIQMENLARQVTDHTTAIQDIAERTVVLSINASIEAARAGDSGRGFTVIAQEVRKLSDNTSELTKRIGVVIQNFGRTVNSSSADSRARLTKVLAAIEDIRGILHSSVEVLVPQVESVAMSVTEAESLTGSVSGKLEEVTMWFQTQDSLRQTIEHISDAITDLGSRCDDEMNTTVPSEAERKVETDLTGRFTVADEWEALGLEPPAGGGDITLF
jgi:methyl-accepting chemotaxis protein